MSTSRELLARQWLDSLFSPNAYTLGLLAGDASFRRYFRLTDSHGTQRVLMDAPPEKENCEPFLRIAHHWHRLGIPVPSVIAENTDMGFILLEDFGDVTLMKRIEESSPDEVYQLCIDALLSLQSAAPPPGLPDYDEPLLRREIALFSDWLIAQYLELKPSSALQASLDRWFDSLVTNALNQPRVPVHRDYHSRNLMVPAFQPLGILDFQDAVMGPYTYDVVSLVKDCYVRWPAAKIQRWSRAFYERLPETIRAQRTPEAFDIDCAFMGMQRHLKASGIFARLFLRDGKTGYLNDIPNTLLYIEEALEALPEFADIKAWLNDTVQPRLAAKLSAREPATCAP